MVILEEKEKGLSVSLSVYYRASLQLGNHLANQTSSRNLETLPRFFRNHLLFGSRSRVLLPAASIWKMKPVSETLESFQKQSKTYLCLVHARGASCTGGCIQCDHASPPQRVPQQTRARPYAANPRPQLNQFDLFQVFK